MAAEEFKQCDMPSAAASAMQDVTGNHPAGRQWGSSVPIPQDISKYVRQLARGDVLQELGTCPMQRAAVLQRQ